MATATTFAGRVPGTLAATRSGARQAARSLQTLPDPTLRWLAASSVGLSAGLFLTGKRRLVIASSIAPALAIGAAIVARPAEPAVAHGFVEGPAAPAAPEAHEPVTVVRPKRDGRWRAVAGVARHGNGVKRG